MILAGFASKQVHMHTCYFHGAQASALVAVLMSLHDVFHQLMHCAGWGPVWAGRAVLLSPTCQPRLILPLQVPSDTKAECRCSSDACMLQGRPAPWGAIHSQAAGGEHRNWLFTPGVEHLPKQCVVEFCQCLQIHMFVSDSALSRALPPLPLPLLPWLLPLIKG